jgi:large subunit ribosomal protein L1
MATMTKKMKAATAKIQPGKLYNLEEASALVKEVSTTKFDGSVDLAVRLGVDPRKANQMVRGTVSLPHGTGKTIRVLALVTDVDVIITVPAAMGKLGPLGRVLGPRGLMPNPKTGTVTMEVGKAVREVKAGKIDFKVDRYGIVHAGIGKVSFSAENLRDNADEVLKTLVRLKPSAAKGTYIKSITLSPTMGPGVPIEPKNA